MNEILKKIGGIGIVPVIKIEDVENAVPLAKALIDGGLPIANLFSSLLNLPVKPGNSSVFTGSVVEVMKSPYLGLNGHIGIKTNSVLRAKTHLENRGIKFNEGSAKFDAKGNMTAIYIEQEIGGFAVHFVKK